MNKNFTLIQKLRNKIKIKGTLDVKIASNAKFIGCRLNSKGSNNTLIIGDNTLVRNIELEIIGDNCSIEIGKHCMIGDNCYLSAKEGSKLIIKSNSMLSRNIKIMTSDGHPIYKNKVRINLAKDITLEEKVWISDNVTILKGITIGSGSVIGINSTLTKDILSNVIAVGNPARVVKTEIYWKD